jgi:hypothetical protein
VRVEVLLEVLDELEEFSTAFRRRSSSMSSIVDAEMGRTPEAVTLLSWSWRVGVDVYAA